MRASKTRCLSPPESVSSCRVSKSPVSVRPIAARAISRSLAPSSSNRPRCGYLPIRTVSSAVNGCCASCCGMNAIRLARSPAAIVSRSAPSKRTSPASGFSSPAITRSNVLLPAPLGPSRPSSSPGRASRDAESRIWAPPSRTETSRACKPRPVVADPPCVSFIVLKIGRSVGHPARRSGLDPESRGPGPREYWGHIVSGRGSRPQSTPDLHAPPVANRHGSLV